MSLRLVDPEAGSLSRGELEQLPVRNARKHYLQVVEVASRAAAELRASIAQDPMSRAALTRRITAYSWASKTLWLAAQAVCDMEELTDDGEAEGIKWEIPL